MTAGIPGKASLWKSYRFPIILLISIVVGSAIG